MLGCTIAALPYESGLPRAVFEATHLLLTVKITDSKTGKLASYGIYPLVRHLPFLGELH